MAIVAAEVLISCLRFRVGRKVASCAAAAGDDSSVLHDGVASPLAIDCLAGATVLRACLPMRHIGGSRERTEPLAVLDAFSIIESKVRDL